jgi:hypothetical protein
VAVLSGWAAKEKRQSDYERRVGHELEKRYCEVSYLGLYDSLELQNKKESQGWWRDMARKALGRRITAVTYVSSQENAELLGDLTRLNALRITCTAVTDLSSIADLENLRSLSLNCTYIEDVAPLTKLKSLEQLYLYEIYNTDLTPLAGMTNLKELSLTGDSISHELVRFLRDALPKCRIDNMDSGRGSGRGTK